MEIIKAENLSYEVKGKYIINNLSICINKNEFVSIIGKNGSGKTTLIKIIAGLLNNFNGKLNIINKDINAYSKKQLAQKVAYVPQIINFDENYTAEEIILMGRFPFLGFWEKYKKDDYDICNFIMEKLKINKLKKRKIATLSGGERQKVFIARAIAQQPQILLLDEPLSQLDICNQIYIMDLLKELNKKTTIICVLHDLNFALNYSNKTILLKNGNLLDCKETKKVLTPLKIKEALNASCEIISHKNGNIINFV